MSSGVETWGRQDLLKRAIAIAISLVPVTDVAKQIVQEAVNLARIKGNEQLAHRRRWQYLIGPKRFLMHENQLVQTMVLYAAQKYERWHEGERRESLAAEIHAGLSKYTESYQKLTDLIAQQPLRREDLVVRYLAALVHNSSQSSRDLATAILCLVCNYQAQEAAALHVRFIKSVSANYLSKRKSKIMEELHTRFANFISIKKLPGRATFFVGQDVVNTRDARLVANFLTKVVPWGTTCPVGAHSTFSAQLQTHIQELVGKRTLRFITSNDQQELIYIHILTCEDCFLKMLQEVNLGCAREHLTLPDFSLPFPDERLTMSTNNHSASIEPEEKETFMQTSYFYLEHEEQRRKNLKLESLWLASGEGALPLDMAGKQVDQWIVNEPARSPLLKISKKVKTIRLVAKDAEGELVVGVWMPAWEKLTQSWFYRWWGRQQDSVLLATGERIKFIISRRLSSPDGEEVSVMLRCVKPTVWQGLRAWKTNWFADLGLNWQYAMLGLIGVIGLGVLAYQQSATLIGTEVINRGGASERDQSKKPAVAKKSPNDNVPNLVVPYEVIWDIDQPQKPNQPEIWKVPTDKRIIAIKLRSSKKPALTNYQWEILDKDQSSIFLERPQSWVQEKGQYVATLEVKYHLFAPDKNYSLVLWEGRKTTQASAPMLTRLVKLERSNQKQ
jgi:hypothetical protein